MCRLSGPLICLLAATLRVILSQTAHTAVAEDLYNIFERNEYVYKIVLDREDRRTWLEAKQICEEHENGELASVSSPAELEWLNSKVMMVGKNHKTQKLWLGATDERNYGTYEWVDGKPFKSDVAPWAYGHPRSGHMEYEACVSFECSPDGGQWRDVDCYKSMGYICKSGAMPSRLTERKRFGYEFDYGYYIYKFVVIQQEWLSWPEAEIYCYQVEGGHLLAVSGPTENKVIVKHIRALRYAYGYSRLWIGASDFQNEGHFRWVDGSAFNYSRWARGQPSHDRLGADCVSSTTSPNWGRWYTGNCLHQKPFICKIKMCNQRVDLGFILDSSGSMLASGFKQAKDFVKKVINKFDVSERGTHVGLIRFATRAQLMFDFIKHTTPNELYQAIDNIEWSEGGTRTERALELARTHLFSKAGHLRPRISKVLVLLTDGQSELFAKVRHEAKLLKMNDVYVVAVGVGKQVNRIELNAIASSEQDVIGVRSFRGLARRVAQIRDKVCEGIDPHSGLSI